MNFETKACKKVKSICHLLGKSYTKADEEMDFLSKKVEMQENTLQNQILEKENSI